jgi:hypothetical protein
MATPQKRQSSKQMTRLSSDIALEEDDDDNNLNSPSGGVILDLDEISHRYHSSEPHTDNSRSTLSVDAKPLTVSEYNSMLEQFRTCTSDIKELVRSICQSSPSSGLTEIDIRALGNDPTRLPPHSTKSMDGVRTFFMPDLFTSQKSSGSGGTSLDPTPSSTPFKKQIANSSHPPPVLTGNEVCVSSPTRQSNNAGYAKEVSDVLWNISQKVDRMEQLCISVQQSVDTLAAMSQSSPRKNYIPSDDSWKSPSGADRAFSFDMSAGSPASAQLVASETSKTQRLKALISAVSQLEASKVQVS